MFWNSFGSIVYLGCQWVLGVLIVRLSTGFDAAGLYSLTYSVYAIFAPIGQYRMYTYQVSDVTNENTTGEYFSFRLITNFIALCFCMFYAILTCSSDAWLSVFLYTLYRLAMLVIDVFHACDQRNHRMDIMGKSLALQGIGTLIVFTLIFTITQSLELSFVGMLFVTILIGIFFDYPRTRQFGPINPGISFRKTKYLLVHCLPIVLAGLAASATPSLPRQFLAQSLGNAALGVYTSVAAPVAIIQMGAQYIYNPLLGYFSELFVKGDKKGFLSLFVKSLGAIALVGFICSVGLNLFGTDLLVLVFGNGILEGSELLMPMIVFALLTGCQWFLNDTLIAIREFKGTFISSLVSLAIALFGAKASIAAFGSNGVTIIGILSCIPGIFIMAIYMMVDLNFHQLPDDSRDI